MKRMQRDAVLIRLIEALRARGSWCGETHVQKATFLLQEMVGVQTGFNFILYKHGPFSFDLRDELAAMRADGFVALRMQDPRYGPSIVREPHADTLLKRFPKTLTRNAASIEFVADKLRDKQVVELERLATAFFVSQKLGPKQPEGTCAQRINKLKPHISLAQAHDALEEVNNWHKKARELQHNSTQ